MSQNSSILATIFILLSVFSAPFGLWVGLRAQNYISLVIVEQQQKKLRCCTPCYIYLYMLLFFYNVWFFFQTKDADMNVGLLFYSFFALFLFYECFMMSNYVISSVKWCKGRRNIRGRFINMSQPVFSEYYNDIFSFFESNFQSWEICENCLQIASFLCLCLCIEMKCFGIDLQEAILFVVPTNFETVPPGLGAEICYEKSSNQVST